MNKQLREQGQASHTTIVAWQRAQTWWGSVAHGRAAHPPARTIREVYRERSGIPFFFGFTALGVIIAAFCGAGVSWDGGAVLFQLLDTQRLVLPNNRWIEAPLQVPVLLLSRVSSDVALLQVVFGLAYGAVPLAALAAAWWVVRDRAPELFVWPVVGIGLGMLPGVFMFQSEANMTVQISWPLMLAIMIGMPKQHVPLVTVLSLILYGAHPYAIGLFALAACLALGSGLRYRTDRRRLWGCAAVFAALAVLALLRFWLFRTAYEAAQLSPDTLRWAVSASTRGLPSVAVLGTWIAALAVLLAPFVRRAHQRVLGRVVAAVEIASIVLVAGALIIWARDPQLWRWANKFTYTALSTSAGLIMLAAGEAWWGSRARSDDRWGPRVKTMQMVGVVFALVLTVQSTAWTAITAQLRQTLATSAWSCVSMAPQGWLQNTPLNLFATPAYALLLQGQAPQKVLLEGDGCGTTDFAQGVRLNEYYMRPWNQGWFDLQPLGDRLVAEQTAPQGCVFRLTTGWHRTETNDPYWWRWSDGRDAQLQIVIDRAGTVVLNGQWETLPVPNQVAVVLNGVPQRTILVNAPGGQPLEPIALALEPGSNVVQFRSQEEAVVVDERPLALNVSNLTLVATDSAQVCAFQR